MSPRNTFSSHQRSFCSRVQVRTCSSVRCCSAICCTRASVGRRRIPAMARPSPVVHTGRAAGTGPGYTRAGAGARGDARMKQHVVCRTDEIKKGRHEGLHGGRREGRRLSPEGRLLRHAGELHARVRAAGTGKIVDGCKVQCPFHRARFDIRTGEVIDWANFPPGIQLLNVRARREGAEDLQGLGARRRGARQRLRSRAASLRRGILLQQVTGKA